jgi:hypothetical protein
MKTTERIAETMKEDLRTLLKARLHFTTESSHCFPNYYDTDALENMLSTAAGETQRDSFLSGDMLEDWLTFNCETMEEAFRQGQDIKWFNSDWYYVDGANNLQDLTARQIELHCYDALQEAKSELADELRYILDDMEEGEAVYFEDARATVYRGGEGFSIERDGQHLKAEQGGKHEETTALLVASICFYIKVELLEEAQK